MKSPQYTNSFTTLYHSFAPPIEDPDALFIPPKKLVPPEAKDLLAVDVAGLLIITSSEDKDRVISLAVIDPQLVEVPRDGFLDEYGCFSGGFSVSGFRMCFLKDGE